MLNQVTVTEFQRRKRRKRNLVALILIVPWFSKDVGTKQINTTEKHTDGQCRDVGMRLHMVFLPGVN